MLRASFSLEFVLDSIELVPRGQQCLFYANEVITYTGTLEGTSVTVGPVQVRLFATCEEAEAAAAEGVVVPSTFRAVEHFVGTGAMDGMEATFRDFGRTDAAGNFEGITVVHGDLNGVLHVTSGASEGPNGRYEGLLVLKG